MRRMWQVLGGTLTLILGSLAGAPGTDAALQAVSQTLNPALGGIPTWYQDSVGLAIQPCLGALADAGPCGLVAEPVNLLTGVGFDPAQPVSFPNNIPSEFFYTSATANLNLTSNGSPVTIDLALEATFVDALTGAFVGPRAAGATGVTFQRLRVTIDIAPAAGIYTIRHPWGETTFNCPTVGARCRFVRDLGGGVPPVFSQALGVGLADSMSTFLVQTLPPPPVGFLGDGVSISPVTGGPGTVRTDVTILGPGGVPIGTTNLFVVTGKKVGMDVNPTPRADLGAALVDVATSQVPVTVTNLTGAPMALTGTSPPAIQFTGPNAADFSAAPPAAGANSCIGGTLGAAAPNNTCTFFVVFNPVASTVAERSATLTVTPDVTASAPPTSISLAGDAEFPITVEVEPNGALQKVLTTGNVAAVSENVDAGTTLTYLPVPAEAVPDVSRYRPLVTLNGQTVTPAADGTFGIAPVGAAQFVDISFVRPGDVAVDEATGASDNQVTTADALEVVRIVSGLNAAPTDAQRLAADVGSLVGGKPTADGLIDVSDVLTILWRSLNQPPTW